MLFVMRLVLAVGILVVGAVLGYSYSASQQSSSMTVEAVDLQEHFIGSRLAFVKVVDGRTTCYVSMISSGFQCVR